MPRAAEMRIPSPPTHPPPLSPLRLLSSLCHARGLVGLLRTLRALATAGPRSHSHGMEVHGRFWSAVGGRQALRDGTLDDTPYGLKGPTPAHTQQRLFIPLTDAVLAE